MVNGTQLETQFVAAQTELTAHDVAMSLVSPQMDVISEAGDYLAQSQGTEPATGDMNAVDNVFETASVFETLGVDLQS